MHGGMAATTTGGYTGTGSPLDIQQYIYQLNSLLPAAAGREQFHNCQHSKSDHIPLPQTQLPVAAVAVRGAISAIHRSPAPIFSSGSSLSSMHTCCGYARQLML